MSLVVEDGTGLSTAESYVSVADADTFIKSEPRGEDWLDLDTGDKEKFLRQAARILDLECDWIGSPTSETQALAWPRVNARRQDPPTYETVTGYTNLLTGFYYPDDEVPREVVRANAVMARYLMQSDRYPAAENARTTGVATAKGSRSYGRQDGVGGRVLPLEVAALTRRLTNSSSRPMRRVA